MNIKILISLGLILSLELSVAAMIGDSPSHTLHYLKPTAPNSIEREALPIGNGSFGAMVFGGVAQEKIQLNLDSLWTGDRDETGCYQNLGFLNINFASLDKKKYSDYTRKLSIAKALHEVDFKVGGKAHSRQYFVSKPDDVMVLRFSSEESMSGSIELQDDLSFTTYKPCTAEVETKTLLKGRKNKTAYASRLQSRISAKEHSLILQGTLVNKMKYACQLSVRMKSGSVAMDGNKLIFKDTRDFEILLSGQTDYKASLKDQWRGEEPKLTTSKIIAAASEKSFEVLRETHVQDYQSLYDRMEIDLGVSPIELASQPTNTRLSEFKKSFKEGLVKDVDLQELIANYGRYLMISCSRAGSMPANLQGLWNWSNSPSWHGDYHSNINVQMNYWMVEQANLSETHLPFVDYIMAMREVHLQKTPLDVRHPSGQPAQRGWSIRTSNGVFGGTTFKWNHPGAAWYSLHLWEHYAFTEDKDFLKNTAYPVLLEICQFWEDRLKLRGDGTYVVPDAWSPEHGPIEDGVTYDQEVVYDLFTNFIEASKILGIDQPYRSKIEAIQKKLMKLKIGSWGQLQEWEIDRDDPNDKHRHVNHLFALHPGRQISPLINPKLVKAARVSLNARGDGGTGWSKAWKISFWARFHDGNRAEKLLNEQITNNFYNNLFDFHPPFQIDGNFGNTAGLHEMLLQSHIREEKSEGLGRFIIHLLPALPDSWPTGHVRGMRARGNLGVDISWQKGQLTSAHIHGPAGESVLIYYNKTKLSKIIPVSGILRITEFK